MQQFLTFKILLKYFLFIHMKTVLANFDWYLDNKTKIEYILPYTERFANLCKSKRYVLHRVCSLIDCLLRVLNDFPLIAHAFLINTVKFVVDGTTIQMEMNIFIKRK